MLKAVKIPKDRLGVIIGKSGSVFNRLRKPGLNVEISDESVLIEGDALAVLAAENIITAIARGFPPEEAFKLENEEINLVIIPLPKNENELKRIRARLIGIGGKARRNIEKLTKTSIRVHGKTAAIIGTYENSELAKESMEKLIKGFNHRNVYAFLEKHHV